MKRLQQVNNVLRHPALLLAIRLSVGGIFVAFGIVKLIEPHEEFFSVIATYDILPGTLVPIFGTILMAVEVIVGLAFIVGLYVRWSGYAIAGLLLLFMIALVQTSVRGIPLEDCGCSGSLINLGESVSAVLWRDAAMLATVAWFLHVRSNAWTVDRLFGYTKR